MGNDSKDTELSSGGAADLDSQSPDWALLQQIASVVDRDPNLIAILHGDEEHSYGAVWKDATAVAAGLQARLGADESPVGIAMGRSPSLISAILGTLRSGRAYVPLDTSLPGSRLAEIARLAAPALCLTDAAAAKKLPAHLRCVLIDEFESRPSTEMLPMPLKLEELAYIIFTSGSTGVPKGIEMRAGALDNLMSWQRGEPRLSLAARTLMSTPLSFDVSFQEIMGCLGTGGTLVLLDDALRRDPLALLRMLKQQRVERIYLPFVALQQLAEAAVRLRDWPESLLDVITAGEQLQVTDAIVQFFSHLPACRLHNHYGPAETHVVSAYTLSGEPQSWPALPPIGTAIDGVDIHLLDEKGVRVEPGQLGEIFLAGNCLARGYLKDPALTSERFLHDPYAADGCKMYKTNDLGRLNKEGVLEWVGRNDNQVKVRGYRVELGEVELAIASHPSVGQAVVVPRKRSLATELVAYITTDIADSGLSENVADSVDKWRNVWEQNYADGRDAPNPTFDISGWNSSYTGKPIAHEEMREWLQVIVDRVRSGAPERVLEIGCGSGLVLFQLAPMTRSYVGLDFSEEAIRGVTNQLEKMPELSEKVELHCSAAHELEQFESGSFDTIVINSVTQHFPGPEYLLEVLRKAALLLTANGSLFVGDVASLPLRRCFLTSIERAKAPGSQTVAELLSAAEHRMQLDPELTIDSRFFLRIPSVIDAYKSVEIQLKRGKYCNEMANYRFDVWLRRSESSTAHTSAVARAIEWQDLSVEGRNPTAVIDAVEAGGLIRGIDNGRVAAHWRQLHELREVEPASRIDTLPMPAVDSVLDPEQLYSEAESRGIAIELRPSENPHCFDVALPGNHVTPVMSMGDGSELRVHASDPMLRKRSESFIPELRHYMQDRLPEFMQPATYVVVSSFPVSASGKIYRAALPAPSRDRPAQAMPYVAPGTELEVDIAAAWCEILELNEVGLDDSFFDLGGNSLLSQELSLLLSSRVGTEISPLQLLSNPTIRALSASIGRGDDESAAGKQEGARSRGANQRRAHRSIRPKRPRNLLK